MPRGTDCRIRKAVNLRIGSGGVRLGPLAAAFNGNFYGQQVALTPGVTVHQIATPLLAGALTLSRSTVCGRSQRREVKFDSNRPPAPEPARGSNGTEGNHQCLQFAGAPGPRTVAASVYTPDGRADFVSAPVTAATTCSAEHLGSAPLPLAFKNFWSAADKPNDVEFMVHNYDANGREVLPTGPATYSWSFGDGQTLTTTSPFVSHDYSSAVNPMAQFNYFTASMTATTASGGGSEKVVSVRRTPPRLAQNRYQQRHRSTPKRAFVSGPNLVATVTNFEPTTLTINTD